MRTVSKVTYSSTVATSTIPDSKFGKHLLLAVPFVVRCCSRTLLSAVWRSGVSRRRPLKTGRYI